MSINKFKLNSKAPFASTPNSFAQCDPKLLSAEAKGTGLFLQSLPDGWEIHPTWVQLKMGYGKKKWLGIAKELISYGCLKLLKGGTGCGSYYEFSLYNYNTKLSSPGPVECRESQKGALAGSPVECRESQKGTVAKRDSRQKAPLIKKHKQKKETLLNKTTNKVVVVSDINCLERAARMDELLKLGLKQVMVDRIINKFTITRIAEVIKMYHEAKADKPGWIVTALKEEWMPDSKKASPQTSRFLMDNDARKKWLDEISDQSYQKRMQDYESRNKKG